MLEVFVASSAPAFIDGSVLRYSSCLASEVLEDRLDDEIGIGYCLASTSASEPCGNGLDALGRLQSFWRTDPAHDPEPAG
jgi:hypothetical protein